MSALALVLFMQAAPPPSADLPRSGLEADDPEVHAVDILDASTSAVSRPSDTRGFMLTMPTMVTSHGASVGFGLEAFPVRTYLWEREWEGERIDPFLRLLSGFNLSLALMNGPKADLRPDGDHREFRIGAVAGYQFLNQRDPLRDSALAACLDHKAEMMATEYALDRRNPRWEGVSRMRLDECLAKTTVASGVYVGATADYGQVGLSYEVASHGHAFTGSVEKRFKNRYGENPMDLGLRYTLERTVMQPSVESHVELTPLGDKVETRLVGGGGITIGLPSGFSLTAATRAYSPPLGYKDGDIDVRGYLSLGWGGYDLAHEMFARGLYTHGPH